MTDELQDIMTNFQFPMSNDETMLNDKFPIFPPAIAYVKHWRADNQITMNKFSIFNVIARKFTLSETEGKQSLIQCNYDVTVNNFCRMIVE